MSKMLYIATRQGMGSTVGTARLTGLAYLGLAITGVLGFLAARPRLFVADDAAATLANLTAQEPLAWGVVALELGIVLTQALAALLFFKLFRPVDGFAAGAVAAFGLVNAIMILVSAGFLATAAHVALDSPLSATDDTAATVQLLYFASGFMWDVAALFFGLWLIPMGWLAYRSRWMPRPLGVILMVSGMGYVVSAFLGYVVPDAAVAKEILTLPATVGEFWMIGYLLTLGVSRKATPKDADHTRTGVDG
ncbi:DUF4386 domain-containing protein [Nocardiopsis sp. NPDC049922]|uniref:DUF4386 domain-containing protein n=1 Tax=Nocardiopsis sp. NPDC049922 TaxID=3155157 RepID=UPI0033D6D56C